MLLGMILVLENQYYKIRYDSDTLRGLLAPEVMTIRYNHDDNAL